MAGRELPFGQQVKTVKVDPPDARYHHEAGGGGQQPLHGPADVGQSGGQADNGLSQHDDREQAHTHDQVFGMDRDDLELARQKNDERNQIEQYSEVKHDIAPWRREQDRSEADGGAGEDHPSRALPADASGHPRRTDWHTSCGWPKSTIKV